MLPTKYRTIKIDLIERFFKSLPRADELKDDDANTNHVVPKQLQPDQLFFPSFNIEEYKVFEKNQDLFPYTQPILKKNCPRKQAKRG
jgi:hypothetical protein